MKLYLLCVDYGSMPATPVPPPPPPPPPVMLSIPPPPPPPMFNSLSMGATQKNFSSRKLSLADSLQSKSLKSTKTETLQRTSSVPSMTDVLKDMGKVKLKKVDRYIEF